MAEKRVRSKIGSAVPPGMIVHRSMTEIFHFVADQSDAARDTYLCLIRAAKARESGSFQ
jgi:hypothetical protein